MSDLLDEYERKTGIYIPIHVDGASGAMYAPFANPSLIWDFRVSKRVVSINTSLHKWGKTYVSPLSSGPSQTERAAQRGLRASRKVQSIALTSILCRSEPAPSSGARRSTVRPPLPSPSLALDFDVDEKSHCFLQSPRSSSSS